MAHTAGNASGFTDAQLLSIALDEVYALRAILAYESLTTEAHLGYKTFPKTRRQYAEEQVERMARAARGGGLTLYRQMARPKQALKAVGASETLTRWSYEAEQYDSQEEPDGR